MANEKNWHYRHNVDIDGADDAETAQNWMHQFFTFLSGGADSSYDPAGAALSAWEIISSSNGVATAGNGGNWASPSDVVFNGAGPHSWFVARKNILPISTANPDGYVWLTVDCENADDSYAWFGFQREEPNYAADTTSARPVETATTYEKDLNYRYEYDAGQVSWFNGIMEETGSFVIWSSRTYAGQQNYPFTLACLRLETPRPAEVDPYPLFLKCAYSSVENGAAWPYDYPHHGVWDMGTVDLDAARAAACTYGTTLNFKWSRNQGSQAMWDENGTMDATDGLYTMILTYGTSYEGSMGPQFDMDTEGSDIDGTYPRLPLFVANNYNNSNTEVRGRIPDITTTINGGDSGIAGLVTPQVGDITACVMGDLFFPATASMLPGA